MGEKGFVPPEAIQEKKAPDVEITDGMIISNQSLDQLTESGQLRYERTGTHSGHYVEVSTGTKFRITRSEGGRGERTLEKFE